MTLEKAKPILLQLKAMGTVKKLTFYIFGEPFLNPELLDIITFAHRQRVVDRIYVATNGALIKPSMYGAICESGLTHLRVSIYGATEESQKRNSGSPNTSLAEIKKNIEGLKELRDRYGFASPWIYTKIITTTPEEDAKFLADWKGVGDEIYVHGLENWNDAGKNFSGLEQDKLLSTPLYANHKQACPYPFFLSAIHADLKVSVCYVDWNKKAVVGDLNKETFSEIWNGEKLREFRRMHVLRRRCELDACRNCTFLHAGVDNVDGVTEAQLG